MLYCYYAVGENIICTWKPNRVPTITDMKILNGKYLIKFFFVMNAYYKIQGVKHLLSYYNMYKNIKHNMFTR